MTAHTVFRFTSTDGLRVACARWDSRGPVRGVVQIAHDMGEHIGRYAATMEVLASVGLIVYGNDHTAETATPRPPPHIMEISGRTALTCLWRTCIG